MIEEVVPSALDGERVDRVVAFVTGCSRSAATDLIRAGAVQRNAAVVRKGSVNVSEGDTLRIDESAFVSVALPLPEASVAIDIVYEDSEVLIVNKSAGLVVHPGAGTPSGTMVNALLARYPELAGVGDPERPGIVHRLDKGTTGLLMVARSEETRLALSAQLAEHSVERSYIAVVSGHLEADSGLIDAAIGRHPHRRTRMTVTDDGRDSRTRYVVRRRVTEPAEVSVLDCQLETGRTHQIRVHLSAIGHPVVGDDLYGGHNAMLLFSRPALHAAVLGFTHPVTEERLRFEVAPPEDLAELLATLR